MQILPPDHSASDPEGDPEGHAQLHAAVREILGSDASARKAPDIDAARERLYTRVQELSTSRSREEDIAATFSQQSSSPRRTAGVFHSPIGLFQSSRSFVRATMAGAAVVAMAAAGWAGLNGYSNSAQSNGALSVPMRTIAVANGQRATITLDDGTHVLLNAGSTLKVPRDLRRARTVELDGEALFTVAHHTSTPFVVRSHGARITVLGTEFTVRGYADDGTLRVAVANGRVSVRSAEKQTAREALLNARMLGEMNDSGSVAITPDTNISPYTDWTRGVLVFDSTPVREAFRDLERKYDLQIRLTDSTLANRHITVTVGDEPSDAVLDAIALTLNVRYMRDGNVVTFLPAQHKTARTRMNPFPHQIEASRGK